jgi:5-methylcytosine-specific restriction endonuclease McrA
MKRRKPIRSRSERRDRFDAELDAITPALTARSRGRCEICRVSDAVVRHHRLRRSQGGVNELWCLLHLCNACHLMVHAQPALSYDRGWLIRGLTASTYCA